MSTFLSSVEATRCCLFCCKIYRDNSLENGGQTSSNVNNCEVLEHRFIRLFESHCSVSISLDRSNLGGALFHSCGACCEVVLSFCEAVHRVKVAEMEADWRLRRLMEVMRSAESVPGRRENFQAFLATCCQHSSNTGEEFEVVVRRLREYLLETSTKKVESRMPRIFLQRCKTVRKEHCLQNDRKLIKSEKWSIDVYDAEEDGNTVEEDDSLSNSSESDDQSEFFPSDMSLEEDDEAPSDEEEESALAAPQPGSGNTRKRKAPDIDLSSDPDTPHVKTTLRGCNNSQRTTTRTFKCDICSKRLASLVTLERHKRLHTGNKKYRCPHCNHDVMFINGSHFDYHVFHNHKDKLLGRFKEASTSDAQFAKAISIILRSFSRQNKCTLCSTAKQRHYSRTYDVDRHLMQHHSKKLEEELKRYQADPALMHILLQEETARFTCYLCSKPFKSRKSMKHHLATRHHDNQPGVVQKKPRKWGPCSLCHKSDRMFSRKFCLEIHLLRYHRTVTLAAYKLKETSNDEFSQAIDATLRKLVVDNVKCVLCERLYKSKIHCLKHLMDNHRKRLAAELRRWQKPSQSIDEADLEEEEEDEDAVTVRSIDPLIPNKGFGKKARCRICSLVLSSSEAWSNHMTTIHNLVTHRCQHCSKNFMVKHTLIAHEFQAHRSQFLRDFRRQGLSDEDFAEAVDAAFEKLTEENGKKCGTCGKPFSMPLWCAFHVIRMHRQALATVLGVQDINTEDIKVTKLLRKVSTTKIKNLRRSSTNKYGKCEYCSLPMTSSSNRGRHFLACHPADVLSRFQLKEASRKVFEEGLRHVFRSLISKKTCLPCKKTFKTLVLCKQHLIRVHEERFDQDIRSYQRNALAEKASSTRSGVITESRIGANEETAKRIVGANCKTGTDCNTEGDAEGQSAPGGMCHVKEECGTTEAPI